MKPKIAAQVRVPLYEAAPSCEVIDGMVAELLAGRAVSAEKSPLPCAPEVMTGACDAGELGTPGANPEDSPLG
jgi:hypothetical protein